MAGDKQVNPAALMGQAWRLARRELRGGIRGFRVVIACLALGVAAIAAVGSTGAAVEDALRRDGGALLGGDVDLRLVQRPASAAERDYVTARAAAVSDVIEMRAMAHGAKGDRALVELKAVDDAYPLVGAVTLTNGAALYQAIAQTDGLWGVVAEPTILNRLGLAVGDTIRVGAADFAIRGIIGYEPDRVATVVNFGPRLMIAADALDATGLVQPGSQIRYHLRALLDDGAAAAAWTDRLRTDLPESGWRIRTPEDAAPGMSRFVERMTLFLGFVALAALLVGGIGVGNGVAAYLNGKSTSIATMKCLGAPARLIVAVYVFQVGILAMVAIALGLIAGAALPALAMGVLDDLLPVRVFAGVHAGPLAVAALFGVAVTVTFSLWPLLRARTVPASALFHQGLDNRAPPDRLAFGAVAAAAAGLALLALVTASDKGFAAWFVGGTMVAMVLLRLAAWAIRTYVPKLAGRGDASWRLGIGNLYRPGNRTDAVTVSIGLGLAVLVAVALVEGNLSSQIEERLPKRAPSFFFLDIQNHQAADFDATVAAIKGVGNLQRMPSLRGRIIKINGTPVEDAEIDAGVQWAVRGDRALTYATQKPANSDIVAGAWWPADYTGPPRISFDANVARGFGVDVGDTLTLNVLGRNVTAEIGSLRSIDWRSLRFDFAIIFAPGTLENAPHSHLAAAESTPAAEDELERVVTDRFANVTAIRVREALEAANRILEGIGMAVRAAASVSLLAGAFVLAGAVAAGHHRRVYDAVVFKVLGAARRTVMKAYVVEYGLLGIAVGLAAAAVGTLTAWGVVKFLMGMEWIFLPGMVAATVLGCLCAVLFGGLVGTWRALGQAAAPLLRNE